VVREEGRKEIHMTKRSFLVLTFLSLVLVAAPACVGVDEAALETDELGQTEQAGYLFYCSCIGSVGEWRANSWSPYDFTLYCRSGKGVCLTSMETEESRELESWDGPLTCAVDSDCPYGEACQFGTCGAIDTP
jgi:hypothetical protein